MANRYRGLKREKRILILIRDQQRCRYCGLELDPFVDDDHPLFLTVDHVMPRCLGGTSEFKNLVVACRPCNQRKSWYCTREEDLLPMPIPLSYVV